jgi:hypothetical protein
MHLMEATLANGERIGLAHEDRALDSWPSLVPLAQEFLDNQRRDIALRERALERDARLGEQARALAAAQWQWVVLCLAAVYLAFLGLGAGLILLLSRTQAYTGNVNVPLLIVSHIGLLTVGILIGSRWVMRWIDPARVDETGA